MSEIIFLKVYWKFEKSRLALDPKKKKKKKKTRSDLQTFPMVDIINRRIVIKNKHYKINGFYSIFTLQKQITISETKQQNICAIDHTNVTFVRQIIPM